MATIDPSSPSKAFMKLMKYLGRKQPSIYIQLRMGHIPLNKPSTDEKTTKCLGGCSLR